ncbi:hypothetical protein [Paenibacillus luteus]|uniref:hypothetical protein n=1 Tax=Paenibacillus luteus TaxID=2545753 RepID=UPI001144A4C0|nr:hypothetical protein [Paenibacillus luteus]
MTRKIQRGRWNTRVNALKQDRIIYDGEGWEVGWHDGRYKLGKYLVDGYSPDFYRDYEDGYKVGINEYDSRGVNKYYSSKEYKEKRRKYQYQQTKKSGCTSVIICLFGIGGVVDLIITRM